MRSVSCAPGETAATREAPSSRQKRRLSSAYTRLHLGHSFIAVVIKREPCLCKSKSYSSRGAAKDLWPMA
jgi:hypothetical protein